MTRSKASNPNLKGCPRCAAIHQGGRVANSVGLKQEAPSNLAFATSAAIRAEMKRQRVTLAALTAKPKRASGTVCRRLNGGRAWNVGKLRISWDVGISCAVVQA